MKEDNMSVQKRCSFHRSLSSLNFGLGIGSCDLEGSNTICDGDILYCERPETLTMYLRREGSKQKSGMPVERHEPSINAANP